MAHEAEIYLFGLYVQQILTLQRGQEIMNDSWIFTVCVSKSCGTTGIEQPATLHILMASMTETIPPKKQEETTPLEVV